MFCKVPKITFAPYWKPLFLFVFSLTSIISFAQPKEDYYTASTLDGKKGRDLELALRDIIYPHTKIEYKNLWKAYEITDPGPADSIPTGYSKTDLVYDMYAWMSQFPKFYSDKDHSQTGGINREHSVPNSWWGGEAGNDIVYTDLHHLVPGDGAANNAKQNYPLGEYQTGMKLSWPTKTNTNASGATYMTADTHDHSSMPCYESASHVWDVTASEFGGAEKVFEPADMYKGDFARMYFYVVCAYEGINWEVTHMFETVEGHTNIKEWALALLLKWHNDDPVSDKERKRNNAVESLQGNRNPFIDFPDLVEYIWGSMKDKSFSLETATSSYDSKYSNRPTAKWTLNSQDVSSVTAEYGKEFTSPTLVVTPSGEYSTTYKSSDEEVATIDANGNVTVKAAGSTTITATVVAKDNPNSTAIASYILSVVKSKDAACYFFETFDTNSGSGGNDDEWSGTIAQSNIKSDDSNWNFTKGFGAKQCVRLGTSDNAGIATTPEIFFTGDAIICFKAGAWNASNETTTIKISATKGTLSQTSVTLAKGAWTDYKLYITGVTGNTQITFAAAAENGKSNRFFLDEVSITAGYVREVNTSNIGTLCLPRKFEKPATMTLYNIVGKDASKIYFEENTGEIEAGRPYLFRSTETPIVVTHNGEVAAAGTNNGLVGCLAESVITKNDGNYIISGNKLYIVDVDNYNCPANRAYIHLAGVPEKSPSAKADFTLDFNEPTRIESLQPSLRPAQDKRTFNPQPSQYNLQGVRVNEAYKGIVITNGKKLIVR